MPTKTRSSQRARSAKRGKTKAQVLSSKVVYDGKVFNITCDKVKEPSGITATRDIVRHSGSVVVLAIDEASGEPRVLLERQYRYAAQEYLWELPAGRIDPGEQPLPAAKRELIEETGYRAKKWKHAVTFYSSPGFLDETMAIYLARNLTAGEATPEEDESIDFELVPLPQLLDWIFSGKIRDAKTIAGALWLAEARRRGRLE
jgi:ADP-ribose pyrophosphatase